MAAMALWAFDRERLAGGACLVGVDEVGRGPLAGPVVAGAVRLEKVFYEWDGAAGFAEGVTDSKRLSGPQRRGILERCTTVRERGWMQVGIGVATVEEIEVWNIAGATRLAMQRALGRVLAGEPGSLWGAADGGRCILIDGLALRDFPYEHEGLVKGDGLSLAVALASIHAKEWRDAEMAELGIEYPYYGFERNKGYGTAEHREALLRWGPCAVHRRRFLRKLLGE